MMKLYTPSLRHLLALFFLLNMVGSSHAQDARLAQFYAAPQQLNPAMTGVFAGQFRGTLNYRNLYSSVLGQDAYRTIAAGGELRQRLGRYDYVAFGLNVLRDQVGESQFTRTQGSLGASYLKQVGGGRRSSNYLVAGAQLGLGQRGFDWQKLWFSEQFFVDASSRQAYVDYAASSGESFPAMQSDLYLDLNAGLLWYQVTDDNSSIYFGGAIFHINEPNISFLSDRQDKLYRKYVGHAGGEIPLGRNGFSLLPSLAVMQQGPAFSGSVGTNIRYSNQQWKEIALRFGAWAHASNRLESTSLDAIIAAAILELESWQLGFSYDITVSSLAAANQARGAFEVSLIYVRPENNRRRALPCPNF